MADQNATSIGITFWVADCESDLRFLESIWRIQDSVENSKNYRIIPKICIKKFFVSLITHLTFDSRILR